ncbi:unnamed protein product [Schistocephalus solidus]|uniref:Uncharacterized protein n=1 Tax=Schistocephalus solidus TaxID=70667 RepID=A0A183SLE7_SCHSO|nr:unnamed protein product [Schistocephalus solidus]
MGRVGLDGCDTEQRPWWFFASALKNFLFTSQAEGLVEGLRPMPQKCLAQLGVADSRDELLQKPRVQAPYVHAGESHTTKETKGLLEVAD